MGKMYSHKLRRGNPSKKGSQSLFFQSRRSGRQVLGSNDWVMDPEFDNEAPPQSYLHESAWHAMREVE